MTAEAHADFVRRIPGFTVAGISLGGTAALERFDSLTAEGRPVDLVLLDMNLVDGHGLQVCRAIRGQRVDVDIIAVTAARDMQIVQEALSYGVAQYIIKPFTFPVFKSKLEAYSSYRFRLGADCPEGEVTQNEVDTAIAALRTHT
ncbi:regulator, partial [Burkholderia multivorans]